ncbi:MAG: general L-amino acid transport system permease protein [Myxococcota bacterium]
MSTTAPIPELRTEQKPPLYRDVRVLRWVGQLIVLGAVIGFAAYLRNNVVTNLESIGLPTGFEFLNGKFGSGIVGIDGANELTNGGAFILGWQNTVRVIIVGIPACTLLGILIGIARLSENLAVRAFGTIYVETFRNIPALVWLFLAYFAVALSVLPAIGDAPTGAGFVVSNRGIGIPWLNPDASRWTFALVLLLGFGVLAAVLRWRGSVNAKTGKPSNGLLYGSISYLLVIVAAHFIAGDALLLDPAAIGEGGRNIVGGMTIQVPYLALTTALVLYTASHVAEVVRGAILAIHTGQSEAASAIALTTYQRYRFIILPQAFRIMIPPLANQYLNFTKNSSLAVAISYVEIAGIFSRVANNAAPAVQAVVILMGLYLSFSLSISLVANFFNRRLSLETR